MKRSEINRIILDNIGFIKSMNFNLPKFAYFTPEEWAEKGSEYDEIRENMLGWDVTDYGHGDFEKIGLFFVKYHIRRSMSTKKAGKLNPHLLSSRSGCLPNELLLRNLVLFTHYLPRTNLQAHKHSCHYHRTGYTDPRIRP